tara:strand:- start:16 stop:342 length:327 start_codon:yes stop_codon:yes gene_type:complete
MNAEKKDKIVDQINKWLTKQLKSFNPCIIQAKGDKDCFIYNEFDAERFLINEDLQDKFCLSIDLNNTCIYFDLRSDVEHLKLLSETLYTYPTTHKEFFKPEKYKIYQI